MIDFFPFLIFHILCYMTPVDIFFLSEVGIYKRKQESKKQRKQELDQENDQEEEKKTFFFS